MSYLFYTGVKWKSFSDYRSIQLHCMIYFYRWTMKLTDTVLFFSIWKSVRCLPITLYSIELAAYNLRHVDVFTLEILTDTCIDQLLCFLFSVVQVFFSRSSFVTVFWFSYEFAYTTPYPLHLPWTPAYAWSLKKDVSNKTTTIRSEMLVLELNCSLCNRVVFLVHVSI